MIKTASMFIVLVLASVHFQSCSKSKDDSPDKPEPRPTQYYDDAPNEFSNFKLTPKKFNPDGKIAFLIAGSHRGANFAQDILDQESILIAKGLEPEEIVCYFAAPDFDSYEGDQAQYDRLNGEVSLTDKCYPADPVIIFEHLKQVAETKPDEFYLFISSHGTEPLGKLIPQIEDEALRSDIEAIIKNVPELDRYVISADSVDGRVVNFASRLWLINDGLADSGAIFSSENLQAALQHFGKETHKTIVLQACHSGGFLKAPEPYDQYTLQKINNLLGFAAARHDRTSFGCGLDERNTYYGGAFNESLEAIDAPLFSDEWATAIKSAVADAISQKESSLGVKPSLPQFIQTK